MVVPDLHELVEAVQAHKEVLLARASWANGECTRLGVFDQNGIKVDDEATRIHVYGGEILRCDLGDLQVGCVIRIQSLFVGSASFDNTHFDGAVWFSSGITGRESTRFAGEVWFGSAQFAGVVCFDNVVFDMAALFGSARFADSTSFGTARFSNSAWFGSSRFMGSVSFDGTHFSESASFGSAVFNGRASFCSVRFGSYAHFQQSRINSQMLFNGSIINQQLILGDEESMDAKLSPESRLAFNKLVVRAGASVELSLNQLGQIGALIEGEDSDDLKMITCAKADYNRLRDCFQAQSSTDEHEELCNYRYLQLSRRVRWLRAKKRRKESGRWHGSQSCVGLIGP